MQVELMVPVFVQIALTFVLLVRMAQQRVGALKAKDTTMADIAVDSTAYPKPVLQAANAFHNQLQLPVLFYVVVAFSLIFSQSDYVMLVLAWVFVITRLWHAWVHSTHNHIPTRFRVFAIGLAALALMWLYLAFKLFLA